jgi:hypothetical protein
MARADLSQVPCLNTNYYEVRFRPFSGSFVRFLEQTFSKPDSHRQFQAATTEIPSSFEYLVLQYRLLGRRLSASGG